MRTEYKNGDLLTRADLGLVFKGRVGEEWKIIDIKHNCVLIENKEKDRKFIIQDTGNYDSDDFFEAECDLVSFVGANFTDETQDKTITKLGINKRLKVLESKIDFIMAKLDSIAHDMIIIHHDIQRGI